MAEPAAEASTLDRWPQGRPVGVLALTTGDTTSWIDAVSANPRVTRWWAASAHNMFSGPELDATFDRVLMLEVDRVENVAGILELTGWRGDAGATSILVGTPMPVLPKLIMSAMSWALRILPDPAVPADEFDGHASDVNPTPRQIERFLEEADDEPLLVLNLNLHKKAGIHPDTGKTESGHEIANNYFRRGIRTFSRLGARPIWAGSCRGAIQDDLEVGRFDQIGLILYPSWRHFEKLMRIGGKQDWGRYREAGLDRSWVVHCRVTASSLAGDA